MLESLNKAAADFSSLVWSSWLIALLFGTHLFLTVRTGFIQKHLVRAIKISFSMEKEGKGDVSQFGSLMTALAATIGTGNIIGVAGAIAVGGPGAVLWMWLTGIFGIATKYSEALLAVKYRIEMPDGSMAGGPMYVLERGLKQKWLGVIFAIFTAFAAFGIGNMTQANSIVGNVQGILTQNHLATGLSHGTVASIIGVIMAALTAAVILGGVKSIARVCSVLVPFMALFYIVGCGVLMLYYGAEVPKAIKLICTSAFCSQAAVGGFAGAAFKQIAQAGIARGLFSNESGLGSAPIIAAAAQTRNPVRQALVSSTGTFWDTVVICMLTGIVLVASGHWNEGLGKAVMTQAAFGDLHTLGPVILTVALLTFVFSTILGWNYYGEKAVEYLIGTRAIKPYRVLWVIAVYAGCVLPNNFVWDLADAMNGLMAIPNLIALIALSGVIAAETKANPAEFTGDHRPPL
jgi:AGCS family alanine or glycine:cation symporter